VLDTISIPIVISAITMPTAMALPVSARTSSPRLVRSISFAGLCSNINDAPAAQSAEPSLDLR